MINPQQHQMSKSNASGEGSAYLYWYVHVYIRSVELMILNIPYLSALCYVFVESIYICLQSNKTSLTSVYRETNIPMIALQI